MGGWGNVMGNWGRLDTTEIYNDSDKVWRTLPGKLTTTNWSQLVATTISNRVLMFGNNEIIPIVKI